MSHHQFLYTYACSRTSASLLFQCRHALAFFCNESPSKTACVSIRQHMPLYICMELSGFQGVDNERDLMLLGGIKIPEGSSLQEQQQPA